MFLELPDLCPAPFPQLEILEYEGSINSRVLDYLTTSSPRLVSLDLRCGLSVLEATCLRHLATEPRERLHRLSVELVVENNGHKFIREMRNIVENSPSLTKLGLEHKTFSNRHQIFI